MSTTTTSIWRTALGVFLGVSAATLATRAWDDFVLQQRINKAVHEINEATKQNRKATEDETHKLFRKLADDEAADDRIRQRVAEELARRASQPDSPSRQQQ